MELPDRDEKSPGPVPGRLPLSRVLLWGTLAFALCLGRHLPFASQPFSGKHGGMTAARFQAGVQRGYEEGGLWRMNGVPYLTPLPTDPPSGLVYANHPPLFYWLVRAGVVVFGWSEFAFRIYPILCSALTGALLAVLAAHLLGGLGAAVATLVYACTPMAFVFGAMPNFESPVLLYALAAFTVLILGLPRRPGRRLAVVAALLSVGVAHDWAAAFVLPGMLLLRAGGQRTLLPWTWFLVFTGAVAATVGAYVLLLGYWLGGVGRAVEAMQSGAEKAVNTAGFGILELGHAQVGFAVAFFGLPAVLALVWALGRCVYESVRRRVSLLFGAIGCFGVMAVCNVLAFPGRAILHEFWIYYLLPAAVLAAAAAVDRAARYGGRLVAGGAAAVVVAAALIATVHETRGADRSGPKHLAQSVNRHYGSDTLLVAPLQSGPWYFYAEPWVTDRPMDVDGIAGLVRSLRRGELTVRRVVVLCDGLRYPVPVELEERQTELGLRRETVGPLTLFVAER